MREKSNRKTGQVTYNYLNLINSVDQEGKSLKSYGSDEVSVGRLSPQRKPKPSLEFSNNSPLVFKMPNSKLIWSSGSVMSPLASQLLSQAEAEKASGKKRKCPPPPVPRLMNENKSSRRRLAFSMGCVNNTFLIITLVLFQCLLNVGLTTAQHRPNQPPVFSNGGDLARFSIPEDKPVGSVVYRLKGTDPESGDLTYSISGEYFRVNKKTGDLTLIKALDRETEPSIDVIISLTDDGHGSEPATVSLRREILIEDRNDNPPQWNKRPYSFDVSERTKVGATVFSDILITDEDWAEHAEITLTCAEDETPLACRTFSVSAEQVDEGKYIGIITLTTPLDFETVPSYRMILRASDGDNVVTAMVTITITDVQDARPVFIGGPYVFSIRENSPLGTPIGNISVQDGDKGNPRDLQLKLIDEAGNNYFRLSNIHKDSFTGTFSAVIEASDNRLDAEDEFIRENTGVYELILEAREYPLSPDDTEPTLVTRTAVAIIINDDDDHLPTFSPTKFSHVFKVPYNPGESYIFPDFSVMIEDGDIDPSHSKFTLKFDWAPSTDSDDTEENENPSINPELTADEVFSFITPTNTNPTIQNKGMITMEIVNITLLKPGSTFDLQIGAYQQGHLVSRIYVPVEIARESKPLPKFNATVYRIKVSEDIGEGEIITRISALNHNQIPNIKYSLIGVGAERFDVEEATGVIKCGRKCVDFEKEKSHFYLVKAKSGDTVEDVVFALLYIDVLPTNDNYPKFNELLNQPVSGSSGSNQIRRSVPDGTIQFEPAFFIRASDDDMNDHLTYSVIDQSMNNSGIYIEPETGELKLNKSLNWAEGGEHRLIVTASDVTGKSTEQSVVLVVQAVQNLKPSFPYKVHKLEVKETAERGTIIFKALAHDPDGQDAAIRYSIEEQPEPDLFIIEEHTGILRVNGKLDYEEKQRVYSVVVRAQDEGRPSEYAKATMEITILDENDEGPKFSKKNYVVDMSESEGVDYTVLKLEASDSDKSSQLEFDILCEPCKVWDGSGSECGIEDAENYFNSFRVDPTTGEIVLVTNVVYKKSAVIEFKAIVVDVHGMKPQNDTATVTVYVLVAERTKPIFGPPWTPGNPWINVTIPENIEVGSSIVTFNAFDYIAGEHITNFTIVDSDSENFDLEGNELKSVNDLDYEFKKEFILSVSAHDIRGGESIANVAIQLQDTNDNQAVFSKQEYKGKVKENSQYPTPIITVEATDRDDPDNYGAVRYALSGPTSHLFQIDEFAGVIQVAPGADIDREKQAVHLLTVLAMDTPAGGPFQRTASSTVQITVEDENDIDPACSTEEMLVPETALVGTPFGNVTCIDPDENTKLTYTLRDDLNLNLFTIDPATGVLSTAKSIRGRGRSMSYIVTIIIEDGKERTVTLAVPITITNVIPNDGKPYFTNENLTAYISEGAHRSTPVLLIKADDTDSYDNGEGRLVYKIMKQIYPCHSKTEKEKEAGKSMTKIQDVYIFRLDDQTGMLSLKEKVDREKYDCFSILISVEDLGTPPQMESQWFEVHVVDIDDNLPFLPEEERVLDLTVNETVPKGSTIYNFTAVDHDVYPNDRITFELAGGGSDLFKIESRGDRNASLILNSDLASMERNELTIVVKCHPKEKKISIPDCVSKIHVNIRREDSSAENYYHYYSLGASGGSGSSSSSGGGRRKNGKMPEMILGVAGGIPVGNLIGNADMPVKKLMVDYEDGGIMYHPSSIKNAPYNVSGVLKIDESTGDIFVWDNLESYQGGHFRVEMKDGSNIEKAGSVPRSNMMRKNVKVFIAPNEQLLAADMGDFGRLSKWTEDTTNMLNTPSKDPKVSKGLFKMLTFDQSNAPDGKTKVCFQLLENENMVSQEKAMQLLETPDLQILFLKYNFDSIEKGCPQRPRAPARLTLGGTSGRFWVERSLLGIASVVAIATISAILILCMVSRHRVKERN